MLKFIGVLALINVFFRVLFSSPVVQKVLRDQMDRVYKPKFEAFIDRLLYSDEHLEHINKRTGVPFTGEKYKVPRTAR